MISDETKDNLKTAANANKNAAKSFMDDATVPAHDIGERIRDEAMTTRDNLMDKASNATAHAADRVRDAAVDAADRAAGMASNVSDRVKDAASAASDMAMGVASNVTETVKDTASSMADRAGKTMSQAQDAIADEGHRLAQSLRDAAMARGETVQGKVLDVMAGGVDSVAESLRGRSVSGLYEDVQTFARRNPGAFAAGAAVLGFALARYLRSGDRSSNNPRSWENRS